MLAKAPSRALEGIKRFRLYFMGCEPVKTCYLSLRGDAPTRTRRGAFPAGWLAEPAALPPIPQGASWAVATTYRGDTRAPRSELINRGLGGVAGTVLRAQEVPLRVLYEDGASGDSFLRRGEERAEV